MGDKRAPIISPFATFKDKQGNQTRVHMVDVPSYLNNKAYELVGELPLATKALTAANMQPVPRHIQEELENLRKFKEEFGEIEPDKVKLAAEKFADQEKELADAKAKIASLTTENGELSTKLELANKDLKSAQDDLELANLNVKKLEAQIKELQEASKKK